jgi:hypothetical protein
MGTHLVERYLPGIDRDGVAALVDRLDAASAELRRRGVAVSHVGSLFLPEEESCFCWLEAPSITAAEELNRLADAPFARISPAVAYFDRLPERPRLARPSVPEGERLP